MRITDDLYGTFELEPILVKLIESNPIQRLKGIHQGGASYLVNEKWNETRYDHSIGVMLLIRKMGGSLEEQVAGLLHDVSHTAFSHVVDLVFKNEEQSYHEEIFKRVVTESEIPAILSANSISLVKLFDDANWSILEQPAPDLCADRIDSTLRDMYRYGQITLDEVEYFLGHLVLHEGTLHLNHLGAAEWFSETYYKEVIDFFMDPLNVYGYDRLSKLLTYALAEGYLTPPDLLMEDEQVLQKLRALSDPQISKYLSELTPPIYIEENKNEATIHLKTKVRLIDPMVIEGECISRASERSTRVEQMNAKAQQRALEGMSIKVLAPSTQKNPVHE
ncbi:HD domain-containing protein [Alkalicoccobacillus porphyridii]|uniref:HD domain-containing protein n=1 Tax=Alkalicoccobacillus porphyridii TaxID=2597270 RepID=A0A553ZVP4_9BACI|nr:HD domain-containing protein [Alkalicoccobacillus porphyridii]TSB45548.1 HD domain-containing protein [Alkalicoccobacillus porphyridii]